MSLFDTGERDFPEIQDFEKQAKIPEEERCESCEGLGVVRWRHSMNGPDYKICFGCHGSGSKKIKWLS
jgi:hypothetical protein